MALTARRVDPIAGCSHSGRIYKDENGVLWNCMLNFTDITYGVLGNNKFYLIQLIEDGGNYKVFRKWGRVGQPNPQRSLEAYGNSLEKAQKSFRSKFTAKSGNEWPLNGEFQPVPKKYVLIELYDEEDPKNPKQPDKSKKDEVTVSSKLPEEVQQLLMLISDTDLIAKEMASLKLDLKRMPLGKLSKTQISRGYKLLDRIADVLKRIEEFEKPPVTQTDNASAGRRQPTRCAKTKRASLPRQASSKSSKKQVAALLSAAKTEMKNLSSEFYSLIPHDFGRSLPPAIDSMAEVRLKIDLLQVLADIEISQNLQGSSNEERSSDCHPLDEQYQRLNVNFDPISPSSEEFALIQRYVSTTHAPTHVEYKLKIRSLLKFERPAESQNEETFRSIGNHRLLWHGSRLSNWTGIVAKGLRIAPPEAPVNGYMFGKGIYFADSVSKSANYCWSSPQQPRGVLLLAEVALGQSYQVAAAETMDWNKLQKKKQAESLHGLGRMAPCPESYVTMDDGVVVPIGAIQPTQAANAQLLYNEFVVYRPEQVRMRYLVVLDFIFDVDDL